MKNIFNDFTMQFELVRTMGHAPFGGADIGECLETAERIDEKSRQSWYQEWLKTAQQNEQFAQKSLENGHSMSARDAYLKSSNYYRAAEFFLRDESEQRASITTAKRSCSCFEKACKLFEPAYERIQIPFEGTTLPGYFFKADGTSQKRPTIIATTGHDGTAEELYFYIGVSGIRRGYNVLTFEGPGQGLALREQGLSFRADWEKAVTPVVDYLFTRSDVDTTRIAIVGYSMGGYFAPRAAAFEHRIVACVANSGVYDFFDGVMGEKANSPEFMTFLKPENESAFNAHVNEIIKENLGAWWKIKNGLYTFRLTSAQQLINAYRAFTLKNCVSQIACPVLICDSQEEHFLGNQAHVLYDKLECPKDFISFSKKDGASLHCQSGAEILSSGRILDWLDDILKK